MIKKNILLPVLALTFSTSLVFGNVVYATGNPAESHDETSPLRRVQEMEYGTVSYNTADTGYRPCSECQKQQEMVHVDKQHVNKDGHGHKQHHHKHQKHHKQGHEHHKDKK